MLIRNALLVTAIGAVALVSTGCEKLKARDNLNKGVQAFKSAKYNTAVEHFKEAVRLDPEFPTARLYLATAYMSQYIPGADSEENMQNARAAETEFLRVLEKDPSNALAIESLASLHYNQAQGGQTLDQKVLKLDEAAKWYTRLADVDPNNKTAFYSLGVITWAKWYPRLMEARNKLGMKPEDPGPIKDKKVKEELKAQWLDTVNKGIQHLERALQIDPEYDEAMAYMNLLIRERADLSDSPDQYKKDIEVADNWVQKALDTKKIKAERAAQNASKGIRAE
jgi:tetratricopeptide (TPR) repeat protein